MRVINQGITDVQADAIIVNLFEGVRRPGGATGAVDAAFGGMITRLIERQEFEGKLNETATLFPTGAATPKVVLVGLGRSDKFSLDCARQAAGTAIRVASKGSAATVATIVHGAGTGGLDPADCARALAEGSILGAYSYDALKAKKPKDTPRELLVVENDTSKIGSVESGVIRGKILALATNFARDLVSAPGNRMTPTVMAKAAAKMACETGLVCNILERPDMEKLGMGSLLGVAQGSVEPPKLVVLKYQSNPRAETLALVGKGLTFDSGGISLKNREGMEAMRDDMAGGAAVIGALRAIAQLKPNLNVLGIVACTENMPSGSALKPGDVITAMTGKTIEIISTDAEGRLVLADAVAYAVSLGATRIVDVATLTGACVTALGHHYSGVISNCDALVDDIQAAARKSGERFWRLPSDDDYKEQYKSDIADIKNSGSRDGGAITGGLIIGEFVGNTCWAHLDIAGTCVADKEAGYQPKGATGVAVRTLAELADLMGRR